MIACVIAGVTRWTKKPRRSMPARRRSAGNPTGAPFELREVTDLDFTQPELGRVREVLSEETWTEVQIHGGQRQSEAKLSHWRWLTTGRLDGVSGKVIWQIGQRRWGASSTLPLMN